MRAHGSYLLKWIRLRKRKGPGCIACSSGMRRLKTDPQSILDIRDTLWDKVVPVKLCIECVSVSDQSRLVHLIKGRLISVISLQLFTIMRFNICDSQHQLYAVLLSNIGVAHKTYYLHSYNYCIIMYIYFIIKYYFTCIHTHRFEFLSNKIKQAAWVWA